MRLKLYYSVFFAVSLFISGFAIAQAPVFYGIGPVSSAPSGIPVNFQMLASNNPTSFEAINLPTGMTFDTTTGEIGGIPTVSDSFNVIFKAKNAYGIGLDTVMWVIDPVITNPSPLIATGVVGEDFQYAVTASSSTKPYKYSVSAPPNALPPGLQIDSLTGVISGRPDTANSYVVRLYATNNIYSATQLLSISIQPCEIRLYDTTELFNKDSVIVLKNLFSYYDTANAYTWHISSGGGSLVNSAADSVIYLSDGNPVTITANYNYEGCNASDTLTILNNIGTGSTTNARPAIKVYPNPAQKFVTIEISKIANSAWGILYDLSGKVVLKIILIQGLNTINTASLMPGVYYLSTIIDGVTTNTKVVIDK
jgi:hypothetical protein